MDTSALAKKSASSNGVDNLYQQQQQQIRLLKQIVKTVEEKSLKEKNVLQKQLTKKRQECEVLKQQLAEIKITERGLRSELRQLNNEMRMIKQTNRSHIKRSSSAESLARRMSLQAAAAAAATAGTRITMTTTSRPQSRINRSRSSSLTNRRAQSPANSVASSTSASARRFDPTEYVQSRKLKLQENDFK